jgi:RpiR family transcriptional regulator, carbohydrate utilization regulator
MPIDITDKSIEKIPHKLIVKLQAIYDSLKTAEKKAADLLLGSPEFFANATIIEAASKAGCSEATLTRLARKLGYQTYPELRAHLSEEKISNTVQLYGNIKESDSYNEVVLKVFEAAIQALLDTIIILDKKHYMLAAECLINAKKIVFIGVGDAATVALSGYQKFIRIGLDVHASLDSDVQLIQVSNLSSNDVVIAISHSGRTRSTVEAVKLARTAGAKVISITNFPVSPLSKNSDIVLLTAAFTHHIKGEIMAKRVTELCLIESLFVNVLIRKRYDLSKSLDKSNLALEINKI